MAGGLHTGVSRSRETEIGLVTYDARGKIRGNLDGTIHAAVIDHEYFRGSGVQRTNSRQTTSQILFTVITRDI
jgi:hypothetical protein